jgi:phage shock protein C
MLGGVCGGIGKYLDIDPILVRIVFVLMAMSGISIALYLILWVLIPEQGVAGSGDDAQSGAEEIAEHARALVGQARGATSASNRAMTLLVGGALIFFGMVSLVRQLQIPWLWWFDWDLFWPALLILAGTALIWRRVRSQTTSDST